MINSLANKLKNIPFGILLILCLTLGLAPYNPPHIWQKLIMLASGKLTAPMDIFDLFLHGSPWVLLLAKATVSFRK